MIATSAEAYWRVRGFRPQPEDNVGLWTLRRADANAGDRVLALAGSSRFQLGLHLPTLRTEFPSRQVVQLSTSNISPLSVLANLAADERFNGTVLCEILPHMTFTDIEPAEVWPGMSRRAFSAGAEDRIRLFLARHLVAFRPELRLDRLWIEWRSKGRLPDPDAQVFDEDREWQFDYRRTDAAAIQRKFEHDYAVAGNPLDAAAFATRLDWIKRQVEAVRRRGGQVIFFQMISSGGVRAVEERRFPTKLYWDRFVEAVKVPALRFSDLPDVADMTCAEGSHLDRKDSPRFTGVLARDLKRRGVLR